MLAIEEKNFFANFNLICLRLQPLLAQVAGEEVGEEGVERGQQGLRPGHPILLQPG